MGLENRVLAGKYCLISLLGRGGMGSVWRGVHLTLNSPVAVKLIDSKIVSNPDAVARFLREAQAAASLRGPHVVQILDYGVDDQTPFIVMELLEGESLAARLNRVGKLSLVSTAEIITHACRALARAHTAGIVHRDLKPENIFLTANEDTEVAKVLDFGIAKHGTLSPGETGRTQTGTVLGTPYYMSPEQAEGSRLVDHRADLWALGVIVFECLTGKKLFNDDALGALILAICTRPIPVPSSLVAVPSSVDQWFLRAVCRDVNQRFASARELSTALRECAGLPPHQAFVRPGGRTLRLSDGMAPAIPESNSMNYQSPPRPAPTPPPPAFGPAPAPAGSGATPAPVPQGFGTTPAPVPPGFGATPAPVPPGFGSVPAPAPPGYGSTPAPAPPGFATTETPRQSSAPREQSVNGAPPKKRSYLAPILIISLLGLVGIAGTAYVLRARAVATYRASQVPTGAPAATSLASTTATAFAASPTKTEPTPSTETASSAAPPLPDLAALVPSASAAPADVVDDSPPAASAEPPAASAEPPAASAEPPTAPDTPPSPSSTSVTPAKRKPVRPHVNLGI